MNKPFYVIISPSDEILFQSDNLSDAKKKYKELSKTRIATLYKMQEISK